MSLLKDFLGELRALLCVLVGHAEPAPGQPFGMDFGICPIKCWRCPRCGDDVVKQVRL